MNMSANKTKDRTVVTAGTFRLIVAGAASDPVRYDASNEQLRIAEKQAHKRARKKILARRKK